MPTNPPPAIVRANNWRQIPMPPWDDFVPTEKVTVIIPYYNAPDKLPVVLAALQHQTYPRELLEIIVSADYPDPTLPFQYISPGVRVIRQVHDGFGVARARNAGARAASGSILVFVDGDIVPSPQCVEAHARWHQQAGNVLTIGDREFVEPDAIAADQIPAVLYELLDGSSAISVEPSDHKNLIDLTDHLTSGGDTVYQAVIGHNFGVRRDSYLALGGQLEDSRHWGLEDTEFGYRAYIRGMIIVFVAEARTWHLGKQDYLQNPEKMHGRRLQSSLMEHHIADYRYRNARSGRTFTIPEHVANVSASDPALVVKIAFDLLADAPHDLMVRVDFGDDKSDEAIAAMKRLDGDSRIRFGPPDTSLVEFPDSPLHVYIQTNRVLKRHLIKRLKRAMGSRAAAIATGEDCNISLVRSWAAHRAEQCLCQLSDVGEVRTIPTRALLGRPTRRAPRTSASPWYKAWMLLQRIHTLGDVRRTIIHRIRSVLPRS